MVSFTASLKTGFSLSQSDIVGENASQLQNFSPEV
jgi:hypothetical protein